MLLQEVWDLLEAQVFPYPSTERLFNLYRDANPELDLVDAPEIRRDNLRRYLAAYKSMPEILLICEAPGPWGCRFSGVPITSESQLLDPAFPVHGRKSSIAAEPHSEYSANIHWRVLAPFFPRFLTWNTVPLHPHRADPLSIRTPTNREIDAFRDVVGGFAEIIQPATIAAVGRKAERALRHLGIEHTYVRHPSQGGARHFERGIREILDRVLGVSSHE